MADYIPGPDAAFRAWQANFVANANANLAALGLVAAARLRPARGLLVRETGGLAS